MQWIPRILKYAFAGLAISILIAWLAAAVGAMPRALAPEQQAFGPWSSGTRYLGAEGWQVPEFYPSFTGGGGVVWIVNAPLEESPYPSWLRERIRQVSRDEGASGSHIVVAAGWPLLCVWCWHDMLWQSSASASGKLWDTHGAILLPRPKRQFGVLPYLPLWTGLAVNSTIWGALAFAAVGAARSTRRALRRRAGRCSRCGYDVKGLQGAPVCPECGSMTGAS